MSKLNNSAKRYVKKVSANPEMSHNKLLSRIADGSSVLEFGPASGAMTEVLCRDKNCKVFIVELDKDCFAHAMKYAADGICCDIETYEWTDKLSGQTFDYIVFADVLEHLRTPEKVLETVKNYLNEDGSVLISVPNIAHNSVIIQMLKNQFIYQSTGILDHTHIKHFTYSELEAMCMNSGYGVVYMDGVYIAVGKNEFDISYADVEPEIAQLLKKRPLGELYQHIVEIKKKEYLKKNPKKIENRLGNRKDFTMLYDEQQEVAVLHEELTNDKVVKILCDNPNFFFETNDEIGGLRTHLNEVYAAQADLENVVNLRTRIQQYQDEVRAKNNHIQELLAEEERNAQRIVELQREEAERNEHIGKLDSEIAKRDSLIQQLQQGEENRNVHIKKLDGEIAELNTSLEIKERELQELIANKSQNSDKEKAHIEELEKRITDLQKAEEERNLHIQRLDTEIEEKNLRIDQLQQGEEERNTHIKKLDGEIAQLNSSLEEKVQEINELMENEQWKTEIGRDYIATLKQNILELQEAISEREQKIVALQENLAERNEKITELRVELEQQKASVTYLENRLESRTQSRNEKNQKIFELQEAVQKCNETILNQKEELFQQSVQMSELQKEIEELLKIKEKKEEEIASFGQEKQALQDSLNETNMEYRLLQNALKQGEEEQKKLSEELTRLMAENQSLHSFLDELNAEKEALQSTCEELSAARQDNQRLEELQCAYDEICASKQELQESFDKVCEEKQNIHEYGERVNDEKDRLKEKVSELEQELRNKQGHIDLLLESDRELERLKAQQDKRLINRIFPKASKRRLFVKLAWKCVRHPFKTIKMIFTKGKVKNFFRFLKRDGVVLVDKLIDDNYRGVAVEKQALMVTKVKEAKDISEYQPLTFVKQKKPQVSIVIPVYNQFEYTYNCLKSILNNSGEITYEIIIANDCSTDLTTRISEVVKNIKVVTNKENLRFLKNCNNAAKHANGQYILFLNNDTQVQPNWLAPLVELIERDEKIGMVGSKLVYADGKLQEAGGILWKDGSAWNYGNRRDPADPEFNYVKEADYISGAAIMIKADLWKEIGGFDEAFAPAYYEDTDLAFEVRKHGYKVMYQPLSVVVHFEGISNGTDTNSGQKAYQIVNAKKFYDKWKDVLEAEHFPNGEEVFKAKDRSRNKKHILVIDHYVPMYDKDAGNKCSFMYISLFVKLGYKVTFIGDNYFKHEPYATELNQMGVEILYGNYYYLNWQSWLKENAYNFDYVYLQRPHISIKYIDLLKTHSNAKLIYFGHDLHYLREYRQYQLEKDPALLKASNESKKREFELFNKADVIYVVGSYEQQILQKEFPNKIVRNIPVYIYDGLKEDVNTKFQTRKDIIFVGGFGHAPNKDAVLWFAEKIFPKVLKKHPDIKWYIVGSNPAEDILALNSENIIVKGFVSDEELARLYSECRMAVVPLRVGAGVKGKVVEAVYNRIPLVTTPIGAEGLSTEEHAFIVTECNGGMANIINNLYESYNDLEKLSNNCKAFIENHFTEEVAEKIVLEDFN